jgi:hypothetical protein
MADWRNADGGQRSHIETRRFFLRANAALTYLPMRTEQVISLV